MRLLLKSLLPILITFSCIFLLSSCSNITLAGYGVVLWGGEEFSLSPGTIVEIHSQSSFDETYTVSTLEDELEYSVHKGFIHKTDKKREAVEFRNRYKEYFDTYAVASVNGVRIREKPGIESALVYKLRKGEEVKVVKEEEITDPEKPRTGNWYRVVTADGYEGYGYGKYLTLKTGEEKIAHASTPSLYEKLGERFFGTPWRPDYMRRMVDEQRINLERFDPRIGLFPDRDEHAIRIRTIKSSHEYSIESPSVSPPKTLIFSKGELKIEFQDKNSIIAEYEHRGSLVREQYVRLDNAMEKTIQAEEERRKEKYERFLSKGDSYVSSSYGALHFREDFAVTWKWREKVPERILPSEAAVKGTLEFDVYLAEELSSAYTGAFSLVFPFADREQEITFVYERNENGIRLIYIPEELIVKNEISSLPPSSKLIMYFYRQQT
jgi:hypothetical protein